MRLTNSYTVLYKEKVNDKFEWCDDRNFAAVTTFGITNPQLKDDLDKYFENINQKIVDKTVLIVDKEVDKIFEKHVRGEMLQQGVTGYIKNGKLKLFDEEGNLLKDLDNVKGKVLGYTGTLADMPYKIISIIEKRVIEHNNSGNPIDLRIIDTSPETGSAGGGFNWGGTPEGHYVWEQVLMAHDYDHLYAMYPELNE